MKWLVVLSPGRAGRINCTPVDPTIRRSSVNGQASQAPTAEAQRMGFTDLHLHFVPEHSVRSFYKSPTLRPIVRHYRYIIVGVVAALAGACSAPRIMMYPRSPHHARNTTMLMRSCPLPRQRAVPNVSNSLTSDSHLDPMDETGCLRRMLDCVTVVLLFNFG
jgi:hypothetical protein